ncbi:MULTISPECIES: hypothetical protein [Xanthomonas]|uniref:Uncharacterized protein n=5 Tax=Xanthomonas TaxID=338 RepID=A0A837APM9_XANVA|nr:MULTISPECIES: hypothetical protein [Xanthomonas]ARR15297.1 hypothetical protein B7L66_24270 [Xanthomonas citri pv. citri]ARR20039.1 hypothetical protein B7L65_24625 [Xanthomonas citri pv. citri]ARR24678.1 hypothetical protein B7L67_24610 [Xanthomonas citri pv. citri]ATS86801.1 hypothetical protein XcfCFBP6991P_23220 [Xanthomonas citri pv. phaseoli var. fuscans]KGT54019.1 hypothetical protein NY96_19760 [Xanthomonas citri pv. fuscans]
MKALSLISSTHQKAAVRLHMAMMAVAAFLAAPAAFAIDRTDLTQDTSGGKNLENIAENVDKASQTGATLFINLVTIGGFVVVAICLYTLWKSSKDEREKPMSAIVGLFIGGAMAGVGSIMWIMRNTIIGT